MTRCLLVLAFDHQPCGDVGVDVKIPVPVMSAHAEMHRQLESLKPAHAEHAPLINHARTRVVGCACGWRTPPGTPDSDTALAWHLAIARVTEGRP